MRVANHALLLGVCLTAACATRHTTTPTPPEQARVVGYYFGPTAQRGFTVARIPGAQLTHIIYAFAHINEDGSAALGHADVDTVNFRDFLAFKQRYPHVQLLISFGGWGDSRYFSNAALPENRARFIQTALDVFFRAWPGVFDGVDLDWEYPVRGGDRGIINRPQDRENLTALVAGLRSALDSLAGSSGKHYLVTIAAPAGAGHLDKYEMRKLGLTLDFIGLMTYDYHSGGKIAHYNAPFGATRNDPTPDYNIQTSVAAFLAAGVPADKLLVGLPFYGRGYPVVSEKSSGLLQEIAPPDSTKPRPKWVGGVRYYDIGNVLKDGFERHWDKRAGVPFLYNPKTRVWISYDDDKSIGAKSRWTRRQGLGGVMIWELSGDDGTLLPIINRELGRAR